MTCETESCDRPSIARGLCSAHWMAWRRSVGDAFVSRYGDPIAHFWPKVDRRGPDECWPWLGHLERTGYGHFQATYEGVRFTKAHRFAYHLTVGPIPDGLDLDHVCHTRDETCRAGDACMHRRCCNPAHLEPVPQRTNVLRSRTASAENARKTHCINGHPLSGDNLIQRPDGGRRCRECKRESSRREYIAKKARLSGDAQSPEATNQ